jgi:hypothetical protein
LGRLGLRDDRRGGRGGDGCRTARQYACDDQARDQAAFCQPSSVCFQ